MTKGSTNAPTKRQQRQAPKAHATEFPRGKARRAGVPTDRSRAGAKPRPIRPETTAQGQGGIESRQAVTDEYVEQLKETAGLVPADWPAFDYVESPKHARARKRIEVLLTVLLVVLLISAFLVIRVAVTRG